MSPALKVTLTLAGILLTGLPLVWLTATPAKQQVTETTPEEAAPRRLYATLHFSGQPEYIILRHNGMLIAELRTPQYAPQDITVELPSGKAIDLEAEASWADNLAGNNALTITLEPEGQQACSVTRWGDSLLHDIFTFTW